MFRVPLQTTTCCSNQTVKCLDQPRESLLSRYNGGPESWKTNQSLRFPSQEECGDRAHIKDNIFRVFKFPCVYGLMILHPPSRAFSLRNLVLEYEWGRVFLVGMRLDSLSINEIIWLFSPLSRPVETWRQFGWLRMVCTRCASSKRGWYARGRGKCRGEPGRAQRHA